MIFDALFKRKESKKLLSHPIFKKMEYWKCVQINHIEITNIPKRNMIRVFLKLYIKQFQVILNEFIMDEMYKTPETIIPLYLDTLNKIEQSSVLQCIPSIFLNKYNELEKDHLNSIYSDIENIMSSSFYKSYMDKSTVILDVFMYHFVFIILNSEKSLNQLNGQMEKVLINTIFDEQ
ncbi:MAG: hypothetical protein M0P49_03470 [Bacilli bacterium]|nr:hypothetical protein [Bacilli bacterium]